MNILFYYLTVYFFFKLRLKNNLSKFNQKMRDLNTKKENYDNKITMKKL